MLRASMARSLMRLGPVYVVVVAPSASLRASLISWLRASKRVRIVRTAASAAELDGHRIDCDLVIASALEGTRDLRALSRRFRARAGLVALTLGTTPLPAGWVGTRPGASHGHILDHAVPHPERSVIAMSTSVSAAVVALVALLVAFVYVPEASVSFQRAALAYASRFPDTGTWWHVWGSGVPYLATASWPLLKLAALTGGGPEVFVLVAGAVGAAFGVAFLLLAERAGAGRLAIAVALAAMALPALWVWPRGGDAASLVGLCGIALALAGARVGKLRLPAVAFSVAASSFGGILWVLAAALVAVVAGIRTRRARVSMVGAVLGLLISVAVTAPPLLSRGLEGLRPPLARPLALSDLVPVVASCALVAAVLSWRRGRLAIAAAALVVAVASNGLALAVPVQALAAPRIPSTGALGRLAVHPALALAILGRSPDLPITGDEAGATLMLGQESKETANARLEWLGADRAMFPDRSAAIVFNERDWSLLDRDRLLFSAPSVRPILTAGVTPTLLVVADEADARTFGEALIQLGSTSEIAIPVRALRSLDELDRDTLRGFTALVIYGQPWKDIVKAETVLADYLQLSGFVYMDPAARAGPQPLLPEAQTVRASADDVATIGEHGRLITAGQGFEGRVVAIDRFEYAADPGWEQAALVVQNKRVIQFGQTKIAGDVAVSAHLVWAGADLPARAAAGDRVARDQLRAALEWMLGAAQVERTQAFGRPQGGDVLDTDLATSRFLDPAHWRIELKVAATGVLFKQRYHEQWRAYQVDIMPLAQTEARTPLQIRPTTHGHMYVTLPPNARVVAFVFERHPYEAAARGISALALFVTLGVSFFLWRRR